MERLRKLDAAAGYVDLLRHVHTLRAESVEQLGKHDDAALIPYQRLQQLVTSLQPLQEAAEGAAPHLLDHIAANVQHVRWTIQKSFAHNLEQTLKKMNWPKKNAGGGLDRVPLALEKDWYTNISRLLNLQKQELQHRELSVSQHIRDDPPPLLPLTVLANALEQRFDYHFTGNKPTNRLDKPEFFLNHVTSLIADYSDFMQDNVQPILLKHFGHSDLAFTPAYLDATTAFINALLPMVRRKLDRVAKQVASQPSLLSHLVQEVIQFDNTLKEAYSYSPTSAAANWRGLSHHLLNTSGYFEQWLAAERDFAFTRYQAIIDANDAGELDYDAASSDATKPSKAAVRLNDLLETITERYRYLSSYSQRMRFLIDIQIHIFDTFHGRLQSALDSYLSMTSTLGRTMASATKEQLADVQGVRGLDRICRIFGSADYLERAMRDWSDDVFFLELWAEMDYRHKNRDSGNGKLGSWSEIQQKTSSALGASADGGLEGALFDETASSYHRLRVRSENVLSDTLRYDIQQAMKPYSAIATWASLSPGSAGGATSAELDATLDILQQYFAFLRKALGKAPLRRLGRQACHAIEQYVWSYVLQGKISFSTAGATQLTTDMRAVCATLDKYIGVGQAQLGMRKLLEGITLLSLPVRGEIGRVRGGSTAKDEDGAAWDEEPAQDKAIDGKKMSLFQVERLVFMDNESARHALDQLGLEILTEQDARAVLRQRVEISS